MNNLSENMESAPNATLDSMIEETLERHHTWRENGKRAARRAAARKADKRRLTTMHDAPCAWHGLRIKGEKYGCSLFADVSLAQKEGRIWVVKGGKPKGGYAYLKRQHTRMVRRAPDDEIVAHEQAHFKRYSGYVAYDNW